jgi:hypothetical protein
MKRSLNPPSHGNFTGLWATAKQNTRQARKGKQLVSLGNAADPKRLPNEMNAIWNPQEILSREWQNTTRSVFPELYARIESRLALRGTVRR